VLPIPPLALPDLTHLPPREDLLQYAAVDLFVQRAWSVRPDFAITDENAAAVAAICVHLDGLPLAIELAQRESTSFRQPRCCRAWRSGSRCCALERETCRRGSKTLRSAIDWSYDLLDQGAQTLFKRLAVFAGHVGDDP
jgi:predicted ATPase